MIRIRQFLSVLFVSGCLTSVESVDAAEYYVSKAGRDFNPGTKTLPFLTIGHGVSRLKAGDTLWVRAGIYDEALIYSVPSGTSWHYKVRIAASYGESVTLRPLSGQSVLRFAGSSEGGSVGEQKYIELDGINLDGTNVSSEVVKIEAGPGYNAHHIRIKNSVVTMFAGPRGAAILLTGLRRDAIGANEFQNVTVTGGGPVEPPDDFATMFYIQTPDNLIENCVIYSGIGAGIQVFNGNEAGSQPDRNIIRNNIIRDFTTSTWSRLYGVIVAGGSGNIVYDNVIHNIAGTGGNSGGIYLFDGSNTQVFRNTVFGNASYGILVEAFASRTIVRANRVFDNGRADYEDRGIATRSFDNLVGD